MCGFTTCRRYPQCKNNNHLSWVENNNSRHRDDHGYNNIRYIVYDILAYTIYFQLQYSFVDDSGIARGAGIT